jgi:hypothetical protein
MPIRKGEAEILTEQGVRLGAGMGYLHLSGHPPRPASGTVTKLRWEAATARPGQLYQIRWSDGRALKVACTKFSPTDCGPAIFKFAVVREPVESG